MNPADLPAVITPPQLADFLQTTTNTLAQDRYLGRGVPFVRFGRRIRYMKEDVLNYLSDNTIRGGAA